MTITIHLVYISIDINLIPALCFFTSDSSLCDESKAFFWFFVCLPPVMLLRFSKF